MEKLHCLVRRRCLLLGLMSMTAFVGLSDMAHAQWTGDKIACNPSGNPTVTVDNVTPATGSGSGTDFSVDVGCRSWHISDPANNLTSGGYCIGIPVVGAETAERRRAYLNGNLGGPYIEFQFVYHAGGAPYIGAGDGSGGWGAVNYGTSSGSTTMPPTPGTGYSLGTNNEKLSVVVPAGQASSSIVSGTYISEPHPLKLWSGTSDTNDWGYLGDAQNWQNCQASFPNSVAQNFGPVKVEINVVRSCTMMTTQNVDFGDIMSPSVISGSVPMASGKISVECTTADAYTIKIGGGQSNDIQNRVMRLGWPSVSPSAPTIGYQLYRPPGTSNVWGDTDATKHVEDPGFLGVKVFDVHAVIPAQLPPATTSGYFPSGDYGDTVKVTLEPYP